MADGGFADVAGSLAGAGVSYAGTAMQGAANRDAAARAATQNYERQKEFASNAIQWKVADAIKAGIHPLYALGASTTSFSPISVGDTADQSGAALSSMGQDIGRAVTAGLDSEGRKVIQAKTALELERGGLENELLRQQIKKLSGAGTGPAVPKLSSKGPQSPEESTDTGPVFIPGVGGALQPQPGQTQAQELENQYGEGVGDPVGFWNFLTNMFRQIGIDTHLQLNPRAGGKSKAQRRQYRRDLRSGARGMEGT